MRTPSLVFPVYTFSRLVGHLDALVRYRLEDILGHEVALTSHFSVLNRMNAHADRIYGTHNIFIDAGVERKTMLFRFFSPAKALGLSIVSCIISTAESQTNKYMHAWIFRLESALALHNAPPFVQNYSLPTTYVSGRPEDYSSRPLICK